ncbi:MAG: hypothetical protein Q7W13_13985 [Bacteroidia bacterium]|nr:hypothetical protein [Bacteroidia bacterium]
MKLVHLLSKEPLIGYVSSLGTSFILFIQGVFPVLQLIGVIVGIGVGVITFYGKYLEIKNKKK